MDIPAAFIHNSPVELEQLTAETAGPAQSPARSVPEETAGLTEPVSGPKQANPSLDELEYRFQGNLVKEKLSQALAEASLPGNFQGTPAGDISSTPAGAGVAGLPKPAVRLETLARGNDWEYRGGIKQKH